MYCAILDDDRGGAGLVWPPHPGLPGGTRALPLRQTGPHSVWQAAEYVMRPLAIVARVAGEHGAVVDLDPARFRIEVARDGRPTGRVVVELLPDAEGDVSLPDWLLTRCVDRVAERCFTGGQEVRAWLREVAEHELAVGPAFRRELTTASNTRSIAQIRLSDLSSRPTATSHGVWLTAAQTKRLTGHLVRAAVTSGEQTAERVTRWGSTLPPSSDEERIARLIHRVLSRKQFRRGSLKGYPPTRALTDMLPAIRSHAPIHAVLPAFPIKQADSGLKAFATLPDLAEFGFLVRLKELHTAVSGVYAPGMRITLLSDAQHYRSREAAQTRAYAEKIGEYVQMAEAADFIEVRDIDEAAAELLDTRDRPARLAARMQALTDAFAQLDIVADPAGTLLRSALLDPAISAARNALTGPAARANVAALAELAASAGSDALTVLVDLAAFASRAASPSPSRRRSPLHLARPLRPRRPARRRRPSRLVRPRLLRPLPHRRLRVPGARRRPRLRFTRSVGGCDPLRRRPAHRPRHGLRGDARHPRPPHRRHARPRPVRLRGPRRLRAPAVARDRRC